MRPSLQKEVLCRGITTEFSSIQEILEKSKDIEDSSRYDIGLRVIHEEPVLHQSAYKSAPRAPKHMPNTSHKSIGFIGRSSKSTTGSKPLVMMKASGLGPQVPNITGTDTPPKEGEFQSNVDRKATLNLNALNSRASRELLERNLRKLSKKTARPVSL